MPDPIDLDAHKRALQKKLDNPSEFVAAYDWVNLVSDDHPTMLAEIERLRAENERLMLGALPRKTEEPAFVAQVTEQVDKKLADELTKYREAIQAAREMCHRQFGAGDPCFPNRMLAKLEGL